MQPTDTYTFDSTLDDARYCQEAYTAAARCKQLMMKLPRHAEIWLLPYIQNRARKLMRHTKPKRAWIAITDHYEPLGKAASIGVALDRIGQWRDRWPRIAEDAPRDAMGQRPQYSFFYPEEEYRRELLDNIAEIVRLGIADVEVHIHHDYEQRDAFIQKITTYCRRLADDHGLLRQHDGRTVFGFIHGNWALDNSRPDGRCCGLNGEIALLRDLGCYADFTMPSLPSPTQGRVLNQVYWCTGNADGSPRSYDRGVEARVGGGRCGDLLMFTGPLGIRFKDTFKPQLETGEIAGYDMPTASRVRQWFDLAPSVGDDLFLKLYTHGAVERNFVPLLDTGLSTLFQELAKEADRRGIEIHWATAWQMYQAAEALIFGRQSFARTPAIDAKEARR